MRGQTWIFRCPVVAYSGLSDQRRRLKSRLDERDTQHVLIKTPWSVGGKLGKSKYFVMTSDMLRGPAALYADQTWSCVLKEVTWEPFQRFSVSATSRRFLLRVSASVTILDCIFHRNNWESKTRKLWAQGSEPIRENMWTLTCLAFVAKK